MNIDAIEFNDLFGDVTAEAEAAVIVDRWPAVEPTGQPNSAAAATVYFDIETGPIDLTTLELLFADEWDETKCKGYELIGTKFDPTMVKVGNLKDEAKIAAKIDEKRAEFEKALADVTINVAKGREEAWRTFVERAPLSAVTGQVLAIGYGITCNDDTGPGFQVRIDAQSRLGNECSEADILYTFWEAFFIDANLNGSKLVGFNSAGFDLPFLVRRSWRLGVSVPAEVLHENRFWNRVFVDLMQIWACGTYGERIKLDRVAAFFGTPRKSGDGSQFHKLFNGTDDDRTAALAYLKQDILVTAEVGRRMGIV
jgi:hypothetical protein